MAFMRAVISDEPNYFFISPDMDELILCEYSNINLPIGTYNEGAPMPDDVAEEVANVFKVFPNISQFGIVYKWWGNLSAPGYMDRTDYSLGDSRADVARELLDMYFYEEDEDMDEEEKEDREWLKEIIKEEEKEDLEWLKEFIKEEEEEEEGE